MRAQQVRASAHFRLPALKLSLLPHCARVIAIIIIIRLVTYRLAKTKTQSDGEGEEEDDEEDRNKENDALACERPPKRADASRFSFFCCSERQLIFIIWIADQRVRARLFRRRRRCQVIDCRQVRERSPRPMALLGGCGSKTAAL